MNMVKRSALAASLIGAALVLPGAAQASAAALAPALVQPGDAGAVQQVTHDPNARSAWSWRRNLEGYGQRRNYSRYNQPRHYRRSGPAVGFGFSVPGFSFGVGVPRYGSYRYADPYAYGYPGPYGNSVGYRGY